MERSLTATLLSLFFVSSFCSQTWVASALNANVSQAVVYTNYGEDVQILCFAPEESVRSLPPTITRLCRYYHIDANGERDVILNATDSSISHYQGPGTYEYFGTGVKNGQCGLKMISVASEQVGEWRCAFIAGQVWQASIEVLKYEKPETPTITVDGNKLDINVTDWQNETIAQNASKIVCCAVGGRPISETKLALYLDEQALPDIVLKKNDSSTTCIQLQVTFTKADNDRELICEVSHPGIIGLDKIRHNILVNVEYSPEIVHPTVGKNDDFVTNRVYSDDGKKVDLYFSVGGNPIPKVVVKRKFIIGDANWTEINNTVQVHSNKNRHEFIVTIDASRMEEGKFACEIIVENSLGRDAGVTIVSPPDTGSNVWIMIVVGVVMSLIFIGIIFFVVNNVAKNRGWCGYEPRIEKYKVVPKTVKLPTSGQEYSAVAGMEDSQF